MTDDPFPLNSQFARWCLSQREDKYSKRQAGQEHALALLIKSVNSGEIFTLDSVDSPMSRTIKAHHEIDDFEMNSHWIGTFQNWTCPCCTRSKFQVSRVGKKSQILAKLVIHHDHMGEALEAAFHNAFAKAGTEVEQVDGYRLVERMGRAFAAYEEVLVCEDCNNADAEAKKLVAVPQYFSFSIGQIRRFIQSADHQSHRVNATTAKLIWEEASAAYELRMRVINAVARAAATDTHWYEPHSQGTSPIPAFGYCSRNGDSIVREWFSEETLIKALGPQPKTSDRNLARWRTTTQKQGLALPPNFIAMLCSEESYAKRWNSVADDWACPVCKRRKHEIAYVGEKGKVLFVLSTSNARGAWSTAYRICGQCHSTLMSLKLEITQITGIKPKDSYGFVSPEELTNIIRARPHSQHNIQKDEAENLVESIQRRLISNDPNH